ncbi:MAG TPA: hypothetical protein VMG61_05275 [Usitatibacter sp.]|nr:hypothetical protein [Usitatibacter sp.]
MSKTMVQSHPAAARARRFRALYEMVRNRADWTRPIDASVDEPAIFAYLPGARRLAAREALRNDLKEAVAFYTGEDASVFVSVNGDSVRFHVRAPGYRASANGLARVMRMFG